MIEFVSGDIFESKTQAIVNPVNCVGVMGAGLAKQFKEKYPDYYLQYKILCDEKVIKPGTIWLCKNGEKYIVSFATKNHWKNKSELIWIKLGLMQLRDAIIIKEIHSIAIPALGCGLGGLYWIDVKELILEQLCDVDARIFVYEDENQKTDWALYQLTKISQEEGLFSLGGRYPKWGKNGKVWVSK